MLGSRNMDWQLAAAILVSFAALLSAKENWKPCNIDEFKKCDCIQVVNAKNEPEIRKIKCSTGFDYEKATKMLKDLSASEELKSSLVELIFIHNNLTFLDKNIIRNESYHGSFWGLDTFNLSYNNIHRISGKAFHSAPELMTLDLSSNEWYVDGKSPRIFSSFFELRKLYLNNAFSTSDSDPSDVQVASLTEVFEGSELYWLEELYLESNSLLTVKPQVFQSLPSLRKLSLRNNTITNIGGIWNSTCHEKTYFQSNFKEKCFLEELDLSKNVINTVDMTLIHELMNMTTFKENGRLDLRENHLTCDCNMKEFYDWLKDENVNHTRYIVDAEKLTCDGGKHILMQLSRDDFTCGMKKGDMEKSTNAATVVVSILFAVIGLVLIIVIFMNRDKLKMKGGQIIGAARDTFCPRKYSYTGVSV